MSGTDMNVLAKSGADFTLRLVRIPSPSGQEDGVARIVEEVPDLARGARGYAAIATQLIQGGGSA